MLMRTLLVRGMLAGLAAGALALVFAWIFGEPQVGHAIAFEDQQARLAGAAPAPELVSRTVQETFGLAVAVGLIGLALGGLFSIAFALCYGRIGRFRPRATAALVAAGGFAAVELVPFLKYPANPPSVYFDSFKDAFDELYEEGAAGSPKWIEAVIHCHIGARPGLTRSIRRVLQYAKQHPKVWFARRGDIAKHVMARV